MNKLENLHTGLTFDDVILVPQYSEIQSRKDPSVKTKAGSVDLNIPIISSPMNTVTEKLMIRTMSDLGGSSVLHRYLSVDAQIQQIKEANLENIPDFFVAVGGTGDYLDRAKKIYDSTGIRNFCVDVANGHSKFCIEATKALVKENFIVMAGNVCTYKGALMLADAGADSIRVGIGPGSMCSTRQVTGHGIPQLTAIEECYRIKTRAGHANVGIIADGGLKTSGDAVKALAVGADALMVGGILAGTSETPGEVFDFGTEHSYKIYAGMASEKGRELGGWFDRTKTSFVPEGASTKVPHKGPVRSVLDNFVGGIKVGMSYSGAVSLQNLREVAQFMRVTQNGFTEGTPHGVRK